MDNLLVAPSKKTIADPSLVLKILYLKLFNQPFSLFLFICFEYSIACSLLTEYIDSVLTNTISSFKL